jgi:hypothetical protein
MNNPPPGAWLSQIEGARTVAELVRMLRDYLSAMSAEDRAQLPERCAPENISSVADIQEWAVALAHADLRATGSSGSAHALHQAALVFAAAGTRLPRVVE